jgi:glycine/D-amino acid oxidase-like deaminating enzyme
MGCGYLAASCATIGLGAEIGVNERVAIAGGGIAGVTAAVELRRRGFTVDLFDPGPLPRPNAASTDITKMIRMDYGADEFYMELMEACFDGWDRWNHDWAEPLYHQTGFLVLASALFKPGGFEHDSYILLRDRGHAVEHFDSASLRRHFPAWAADRYPEGYYNPRGGWAESGRVVARLVEEAKRVGVGVHEGITFDRLLEKDGRVVGFAARDGSEVRCNHLIVSAGTWTPALLPQLADVMWSVGQPVLHFKPDDTQAWQPPRFVPWAADIAQTGWYGFAALADGVVQIANHGPGRRMHPDDERVVTADHEAMFRGFLRESLPGLAEAPIVGRRLCLYCDTFDGDFWFDRDPERPGLIVAAGGSGHMFKFAPLLGVIAADVLEGKPNRFAGRFAWRVRGDMRTEDARYSNLP